MRTLGIGTLFNEIITETRQQAYRAYPGGISRHLELRFHAFKISTSRLDISQKP